MFFVMLWIYSCGLLHRVGEISANSSGARSIYIFKNLATDIISATAFCLIRIFRNFSAHYF